jgi:hypothetical protein
MCEDAPNDPKAGGQQSTPAVPTAAGARSRHNQNGRNDTVPREPTPAPPFDHQGWLAAVRAMSPQEQYDLANRIQVLRNEPPLPLRAAM